MKKRLYGFLAAVCLVLSVIPAARAAATDLVNYPVTGGNIQFDKRTGTVTDCDQSVTRADIPEQIEGVGVTAIGSAAFADCYHLTDAAIPDSVTSIGDYAFGYCGLTEINIPSGVTSIDYAVFYSCGNLAHVTIPSSVTSIGDSAFYRCRALTEITIPNSVTSIGGNAFFDCSGLTSVTVPSSVTSLGRYAFYRCDSLMSVTIPDSVTSIGEYAFEYCRELTDVSYGGTKADYEASLLPNIGPQNDEFLNASFHFQYGQYGIPSLLLSAVLKLQNSFLA